MAFIKIEGVLFNEHKTSLLHCPSSSTGVYKIPSTVTSIGIQAFFRCSQLLSITLPPRLSTIELMAFEGCKHLHTICIPQTVISIGYRAFAHCNELRSIELKHQIPPQCSVNYDIFKHTDISRCTLIVPLGTRKAYLKAPLWSDFGSIVEVVPEKNNSEFIREKQQIAG